jgi:hypothetical protein
MKKPRLILLPMWFGAILSIEGCVSTPKPDLCQAVKVPPPFPKVAQIDINETRVLYDDGGLKVLQNYAATREALQAACGQ